MIKEDCLYCEKGNDMGATIHWCKMYKDIIDTCDKCNEYLHKDLVQVVRCKECEFSLWPEWDSDEVYCTKHNNWFKNNGYCHLGRRKDVKTD